MTENTETGTDAISRRKFVTAAGAAGLAGLAGCAKRGASGGDTTNGGGGGGDELTGNIDIYGSSTVFPLATAVKEGFEDEHSKVKVSISSTGSGGGFSNYFCKGDADFNNASRPIKDSEKQKCKSNDVDWVELKVATDALTVIVNKEADWVDCITVDELKQIWEPDGAQKWSDVRSEWPDKELDLYGPTSASGTFDYFTEAVIGEEDSHRQDYSATEQDRQIITGVKGSSTAMGYLGFAYYSENTDEVKALAVDNGDGKCVKPSIETAKSGEYKPLSRPLFTYPRVQSMQEEPQVRAFAEYFVEQSAERSLVADKVGYVPNSEEEMQAQMDKLSEYLEE
ncbi:PstS family phosphate ABC transporter substrate-binding protein [Haloarchaeobius amylolyticus]|uniref:PstS family phosphate ABC transporter substrate-binding protein n=1 Tax=Haloarchaeobius amylolyticus TaxID=1198296 RepID=UPI00226F00F6|nr:PstS family phosphate ABC transporter substrate-binding protein [Haloarchaeobius amylolyticus]